MLPACTAPSQSSALASGSGAAWATARATLVSYNTPTHAAPNPLATRVVPVAAASAATLQQATLTLTTATTGDGGTRARPTQPPAVPPTATNQALPAGRTTLSARATAGQAAIPTPQAPVAGLPDFAALNAYLLELVNQDRQANGLAPVRWDATAARAGAAHAEDMTQNGYFSHWDRAGQGPDVRYSLAGGLDSVMENIYVYSHTPGFGPKTDAEWRDLVRQAEQEWMNSPGHRANILTPEHTGLGSGIAYNAATGRLLLVQEFTDHYVTLQAVPTQAKVGQQVQISGQLEAGASNPLINLAYEPLPQPMSVADLNKTGSYSSPAQIYQPINVQAGADGRFSKTITLGNGGQAGLYHVRVWVASAKGRVLASDVVVSVG